MKCGDIGNVGNTNLHRALAHAMFKISIEMNHRN